MFVPDQRLPAPPPSAKGPSIWDKQHISETLANISAGFLSNQNFAQGVGAAAQSIAGSSRQLREEGRKSTTYGGPGDQFAITTDANGNRTVAKVPEFAQAVEDERAAKNAPSPKDRTDARSRAVFAVSQLPPEQRQQAYANLIAHPEAYGIDARGLPQAWSDEYGSVAGYLGTPVDKRLDNTRADRLADDRIETNAARVAQGDARVAQGAQRVALSAQAGQRAERASTRAERKASLPKAPPGRRSKASASSGPAVGTRLGGYTFTGGDPNNKANWKK